MSEMSELALFFDEIIASGLQKGMKERDIAKAAGLSPSSFSRVKGAKDIKYSTLKKIAQSVGLRIILVPDTPISADIEKGSLFQ